MDLSVQYLGDEPNAYRKSWASATLRTCLIASWPYEAAAGNQSIPAVYKAINDFNEGYLADRFYLPATPRDLKLFERNDYPIFGIESKHQLMDFDIVGTSIAYPVLILSFAKMLTMSGFPLRWRDRQAEPEKYPMVMVGGQAYGSPEPLAPIIDCFWLGEVEDEPGNPGIGGFCDRIAQMKAEGRWGTEREECYKDLAREFNHVYFPRFVDFHYEYQDRSHVEVGPNLSKQVVSYTSNLDGMKMPFLRRIVKDLDKIKPLTNPPLLYANPGMGAGDLEVGRGCPAWCSFCALTFRQKPYRQRSVPYMVEFADEFVTNMGGTGLTPFMPDFPMHTQRKKLIYELLTKVSDEVDSPAMRVDDFISDSDYILLQVHGGMDGVTLGVEGNSQRMRDLVGKGCSDADIKEAVSRGIRAGIRKFKLFMISNLPGEDEGDIFRVLKLAKDVADIRDSMNQPTVRIQFSWTPLMVEANTPFQWFAPPTSQRVLGDVWEEFRDLKIDFKLGGKSEPNKAAFFQLCQRASRDVGEAIVDAMEEINTACWGGVPKYTYDLLDRKLKEHGFLNGFDDCFDERLKHDMFGWEHIDQGISPELLWVTYLQMREFAEQTDSHTYDMKFGDGYHGNEWNERCDTSCQGKTCGACDADDLRKRREYIIDAQSEIDVDLSAVRPIDQKSQALKIRARIFKPEEYRFIENSHWRFNIRRAAFRAQKRLGTPYGIAKRSIRFSSDDVVFRDWTCGVDYVEWAMTKPMTTPQIEQFVNAMNTELGRWIDIVEWRRHPANSVNMRTETDAVFYELELDDPLPVVINKIQDWRNAEYVKMTLKKVGGYFNPAAEVVNARDYVEDLWLIQDGHRVKLRMIVKGRPSPFNIYAALMGKSSWIEAAKKPAVRIDAFVEVDRDQQDFFRPSCQDCGKLIHVNMLDQPYDPELCPRCKDSSIIPMPV